MSKQVGVCRAQAEDVWSQTASEDFNTKLCAPVDFVQVCNDAKVKPVPRSAGITGMMPPQHEDVFIDYSKWAHIGERYEHGVSVEGGLIYTKDSVQRDASKLYAGEQSCDHDARTSSDDEALDKAERAAVAVITQRSGESDASFQARRSASIAMMKNAAANQDDDDDDDD